MRKHRKRGTAKAAHQRRIKILGFIKRYGRWAFDRQQWATNERVSKQTIDDDLVWLKKHCILERIDTEEIKFELHDGLKQLLTQARTKALSAQSDHDRLRWSNTYSNLTEKFSRFLEDFGAKPKATQTIAVQEGALTAADFEKYYKEVVK